MARAQSGDLDAFEDLVNRHSRRVYRALVGVVGNFDEAQDAMQETFLKAFQHIGSFQRRSKFSTWLLMIASNTGLQRLRDRKPLESLDDAGAEPEEDFRPRQVRAWTENPEQLYSAAERRGLVERGMLRLPAKYRVVLVLRDIGTTIHGGDGHSARPGNSGDKKPPVPGAPDVARSSGASLRVAIGAERIGL